jgi:type I restriction enzyme M protein
VDIGSVIKSVQDIMRQDAGVDGDAQRISQLTWLIFLKVFDAKEEEWELFEKKYKPIIPKGLRWRDWASDEEGITGDALLEFINNQLFKKLKGVTINEATDPRLKIVHDVFEDSYNYMKSGTLIRQVVNKLNEVHFESQKERHLFNDIYETILKDLQSAGNAGEYYTPRPVTQFVIDMLNPKLGEKVGDLACGTGGFLICALEHLKKQVKNVEQNKKAFRESIFGVEKKPMPHLLAMTNMILHDIDIPNIQHDNSLSYNVRDIKPKDKVDVVAMNPPFGGTEEGGIEMNFPSQFRTKETADLFMVKVMFSLKEGGRAGIVLPDGFLFGEGVKTEIKKKLLEEFNLHTIVRLPKGVFAPYTGINTNLLFFDKKGTTKEIWYFEHPYPDGVKMYNKTRPIRHEEFDLEKKWWNKRKESTLAWKISLKEIIEKNYNLDFKNPSVKTIEHQDPKILLKEYQEIQTQLNKIRDSLAKELDSAINR